jgi:hypothetical protein
MMSAPSRREVFMRRLVTGLVAGAVLGMVVGGALLAGAVTGTHHPDSHWLKSTDDTDQTSSNDWRKLDAMRYPLCVSPQFAMDVSASVRGGPVEFRVKTDSGEILKPGGVRFEPESGREAFSFTFVRSGGPTTAGLNVQWRSATGQQLTFDRGTLYVFTTFQCG